MGKLTINHPFSIAMLTYLEGNYGDSPAILGPWDDRTPGSGGSFLVSPWPQGMGGYGLLILNVIWYPLVMTNRASHGISPWP